MLTDYTYLRSKRTQQLLDLTSDGIVVVDLQGKVLQVNRQFEIMHGWSREEVVGLVLPMTPEELKQDAYRMYQRIIEGEQFTGIEALKLRKDGTTFYASVTVFPLRDEHGNVFAFVGVERDISDKWSMEKKIKESEERYRVLVESSTEPILVFTMEKIVYANLASVKLLGAASSSQLLGQQLFHYVHPDYREALEEQLRRLFLEDKPSDVLENKLLRVDQEIVEVELKAIPVMYQNVPSMQLLLRDVTERNKSRILLEEQEIMFRRSIKLSPEPIFLHRDSTIHFVNDMGCRLLGVSSSDEIAGRSVFDYFLSSDHEKIKERLRQVVQSDDCLEFVECHIVLPCGRLIDVEMSSIYIHKYLGYPIVQTVIRDLTERKKAEERLRRSEMLSVVGELAAGVAHEVRNPLTALKGFVQLLLQQKSNYADIMLQEIDRINSIVTEFLTIAKPKPIHIVECEIEDLIKDVHALLLPQALLCSVTMVVDIAKDMKSILGEPNQIKQVLINVLKNAIEAMPGGGGVYIDAYMMPNRHAIIRIADQGKGIPKDKLAKVGDPFFTTKEGGTGLGLMVCQRIIQEHHGTLTFQSEENVGTTVEIALPSISDSP